MIMKTAHKTRWDKTVQLVVWAALFCSVALLAFMAGHFQALP
jgi:hypothetical protein